MTTSRRRSTPGCARSTAKALVKYASGTIGLTPVQLPPSDGWLSDTTPAGVAWNRADASQVVPPRSVPWR
jgi:hypothetical protein